MSAHHVVNISGGKDSAATALLAAERGQAFSLWMADTGNEHPATVDYSHYVAEFLGRPLNIARADFSRQIDARRRFVETHWRASGVDESIIQRALAVLVPTGNPFLDLCIWKGRFPSRTAQFCTEFLKQRAIEDACTLPLLATAPVIQWLGVRRDESLNRRNAPMFQKVRRRDAGRCILLFRPIIHWTAQDVFAFAKAKGLKPNPLYRRGFGRVGCFPCINANKQELANIGRGFPEVVQRLQEWESVVADVSQRGRATFFASGVTPEGNAQGKAIQDAVAAYVAEEYGEDLADTPEAIRAGRAHGVNLSTAAPWPNAAEVFDWAKTTRGGRQYDLLGALDDGLSCSSQYGLCE